MTRINTMGTGSCAAIAIQGFKENDKLLEKAYKSKMAACKGDLNEFYSKILHPVLQPLGGTEDWAFSEIMASLKEVNGGMGNKFIILTLNFSQNNEIFWRSLIIKHGFTLVDVTDNIIGTRCYIYTRNNQRPAAVTQTVCEGV